MLWIVPRFTFVFLLKWRAKGDPSINARSLNSIALLQNPAAGDIFSLVHLVISPAFSCASFTIHLGLSFRVSFRVSLSRGQFHQGPSLAFRLHKRKGVRSVSNGDRYNTQHLHFSARTTRDLKGTYL